MSAPETHLHALATVLEQRGFHTCVRQPEGCPPTLTVINPQAPVLTEKILIGAGVEEELAFFFPWPQKIAPATEPVAAAERIECVLAEVGR